MKELDESRPPVSPKAHTNSACWPGIGGIPSRILTGWKNSRPTSTRVVSELLSLEAERDSLSDWEGKALDRILPLMHDVADSAEKALQTYSSDRRQLWATSYVDDTARIYKDAGHVAALLHDYLKFAKTREKEPQIEQSLGEGQ